MPEQSPYHHKKCVCIRSLPRGFPLWLASLALTILSLSCHGNSNRTDHDSDVDEDINPDATENEEFDGDEDNTLDADKAADILPDSDTPSLTLSLSVESNPICTLTAIAQVTSSARCNVTIEVTSDHTDPWRTGMGDEDVDHRVDVVGMHAESQYQLQAIAFIDGVEVARSESVDFTTGALPSNIPEYEVIIHDPDRLQPGFTIVAPYEFPVSADHVYYFAIDTAGEVVWYYPIPVLTTRVGAFLSQLEDGNFLCIIDNGLRIITIGGVTVHEITAEMAGVYGFHHEGIMLPDGNLMTLTSEKRELDIPELGGVVSVAGDRILELAPSGEVVWQWSTFDHLDLSRFPDALSTTPDTRGNHQHTHSNALVYDEMNDSVLLSMRHQHWIINIDHITGDILWRLGNEGDFTLHDYDPLARVNWFYGQHAPELQTDGTILLYDNGNERPETDPFYSRGVMYRIDDATFEAELLWQYETDYYTSFVGDADRLPNGNILLCAGGTSRSRLSPPAQVLEVTDDLEPERVWEMNINAWVLYRALRIETFYP